MMKTVENGQLATIPSHSATNEVEKAKLIYEWNRPTPGKKWHKMSNEMIILDISYAHNHKSLSHSIRCL